MSKSNTVQIEKQENRETLQTGGFKRILTIVGLTLFWVFLSAVAIGSLAAAVWTLIPTALLPWGASNPNLLGYVSHCSYAPISTLVLLSMVAVGISRSHKLKRGRAIGLIAYTGTVGGLLIGLLDEVGITMFIGMGAGVGVGFVLGLIAGIVGQTDV